MLRACASCLVEQNALMALSVAHRGYVLETGTIMLTGTGQELLDNPQRAKRLPGALTFRIGDCGLRIRSAIGQE